MSRTIIQHHHTCSQVLRVKIYLSKCLSWCLGWEKWSPCYPLRKISQKSLFSEHIPVHKKWYPFISSEYVSPWTCLLREAAISLDFCIAQWFIFYGILSSMLVPHLFPLTDKTWAQSGYQAHNSLLQKPEHFLMREAVWSKLPHLHPYHRW